MDHTSKDKRTPSPSPWQHRVHPVTSSMTDSPGYEAKNSSWECDWSAPHTDNCLDSGYQGQRPSKEPLPVRDHVTSQAPSSGLLVASESSPPRVESSHSNGIERQKTATEKECYDRHKKPQETGGGGPGGNTFEPPKRRPNPSLCSPYALNSPLYRPYPYVHGRYGNSESPIASLQCGLNKISKEQTNCAEGKQKDGDAKTTPGVKKEKKKKAKKSKNSPRLRVKQPENYMGLAILICVLFNCPMGLAAIFVSRSATKHFSDGDMAGGRKRACCSLVLSLVSIVVAVLVVITVVFLVAANSTR